MQIKLTGKGRQLSVVRVSGIFTFRKIALFILTDLLSFGGQSPLYITGKPEGRLRTKDWAPLKI
ncbi:hypothetical protein JYQ62_15635 [Nostoc sp. UHCC 0702]|nr:hypothetical protein JYQ62_15635 [Nostoc sp. UHCC 0702]